MADTLSQALTNPEFLKLPREAQQKALRRHYPGFEELGLSAQVTIVAAANSRNLTEEALAELDRIQGGAKARQNQALRTAGGVALDVGLPTAGEVAGRLSGPLSPVVSPVLAGAGTAISRGLQGDTLGESLRQGAKTAGVSAGLGGAGVALRGLSTGLDDAVRGPSTLSGAVPEKLIANRLLRSVPRLQPEDVAVAVQSRITRRSGAMERLANIHAKTSARLAPNPIVSIDSMRSPLARIARERGGEAAGDIAEEALKLVGKAAKGTKDGPVTIAKVNRIRSNLNARFSNLFNKPNSEAREALKEVQGILDDASLQAAKANGAEDAANFLLRARSVRANRNFLFSGRSKNDLKLDEWVNRDPAQVARWLMTRATGKEIRALKAELGEETLEQLQILAVNDMQSLSPRRLLDVLSDPRQSAMRVRLEALFGRKQVEAFTKGARGSAILEQGNIFRLLIPKGTSSGLRHLFGGAGQLGLGGAAIANPKVALGMAAAPALVGAGRFAAQTPAGRRAGAAGLGQLSAQIARQRRGTGQAPTSAGQSIESLIRSQRPDLEE